MVSLATVGGKITAALMNQLVAAANGQGLTGIIPASVGGTGVSVGTMGKVTYTAATAVSVNGVFTGSYDNYRIVINSPTRSAAATLNFRLRQQSATDITTSTYLWTRGYDTGTARTVASSTGGTAFPIDTGVAASSTFDGYVDCYGPATAGSYSSYSSVAAVTGAGVQYQFTTTGQNTTTTASDGFTIYPLSGTLTGTLRVYGYNNLT